MTNTIAVFERHLVTFMSITKRCGWLGNSSATAGSFDAITFILGLCYFGFMLNLWIFQCEANSGDRR